jgi:hypothetical protein
MRTLTIEVAALLLTPSRLGAQEPTWEIGTRLGATRIWREGRGDTSD